MGLTPPTHEKLQHLRQKANHLHVDFRLPLGPKTLWPHLSNADLMNESLEMDNPEYTFHETEEGRPYMTVSTKMAGFKQHYFEFPYQWVLEKHLRVERVFDKGLFRYLSYGLELEPEGEHASRLRVSFYYISKVPELVSKPVLNAQLNKIKDIFKEVSERLPRAKANIPAAGYMQPKAIFYKEIEALNKQWGLLMPDSPVPEAVASYLYCAPERYVQHLRSNEVALYFDLAPQDVLQFCLWASKEGWLIPRWAMLCTSCWGAKNQTLEMQQVVNQYHCESCGHDYATGMDKNMELVFAPVKALRKTQEKNFCVGSPANTPHVQGQIWVWPTQEKTFKLDYPAGAYRLWCESQPVALTLTDSENPQHIVLDLASPPDALSLGIDSELKVSNSGGDLRLLRLENLAFHQHIVTPTQLYALPEFHEMFADQIPAAGLRFETGKQSFLSIHIHYPEQVNGWVQEELNDLIGWNCREHRGALVQTGSQKYTNYLFSELKDVFLSSEQILTHFHEMQALYSDTKMGLSLMVYQSACAVFSQEDQACFDIEAFQPDESLMTQDQGLLLLEPAVFDSEDLQNWLVQQSQVHTEILEDPADSRWVRIRLVYLNRLRRPLTSKS